MTVGKQPMTEIELQRLVDGELSHGQRAELLRSLGDDARQWRSLALALLEEQQWSRSIRRDGFEVVGGDRKHADSDWNLAVEDSEIAKDPEREETTSAGFAKTVADVSYAQGWRHFGASNWFMALAASTLLTVGVSGGMWIRSLQTSSSEPIMAEQRFADPMVRNVASNPMPRNELAPRNELVPRNALPPRNPDSMRMVLAGDKSEPSEIPLVDAREIDPNLVLANEAYELARLKQEMRRRGYRLEVQPKLYTGRLNDGRQVVVPVHNVALKSVGL